MISFLSACCANFFAAINVCAVCVCSICNSSGVTAGAISCNESESDERRRWRGGIEEGVVCAGVGVVLVVGGVDICVYLRL